MAIAPTPHFRTKTRGQQLMEQQIGEPIEVALQRLYVKEKRDQREIAEMWGLDRATVSRWLRDFNISRLSRT